MIKILIIKFVELGFMIEIFFNGVDLIGENYVLG
jgi:hypothetical protein